MLAIAMSYAVAHAIIIVVAHVIMLCVEPRVMVEEIVIIIVILTVMKLHVKVSVIRLVLVG